MSLGSLTVAAMDGVFEVMLEVHLADGGDVSAPRRLPPGVRGHWDELLDASHDLRFVRPEPDCDGDVYQVYVCC